MTVGSGCFGGEAGLFQKFPAVANFRDLCAAMDWDTMKENAMPLKRGHAAASIQKLLQNPPSITELENQRQFARMQHRVLWPTGAQGPRSCSGGQRRVGPASGVG